MRKALSVHSYLASTSNFAPLLQMTLTKQQNSLLGKMMLTRMYKSSSAGTLDLENTTEPILGQDDANKLKLTTV